MESDVMNKISEITDQFKKRMETDPEWAEEYKKMCSPHNEDYFTRTIETGVAHETADGSFRMTLNAKKAINEFGPNDWIFQEASLLIALGLGDKVEFFEAPSDGKPPQPTCVLICGDLDDPLYQVWKDGEKVAGYYVSFRGWFQAGMYYNGKHYYVSNGQVWEKADATCIAASLGEDAFNYDVPKARAKLDAHESRMRAIEEWLRSINTEFNFYFNDEDYAHFHTLQTETGPSPIDAELMKKHNITHEDDHYKIKLPEHLVEN